MTQSYVLVSDDDPEIYALLRLILQPLSLKVRYARNGCEALAMIEVARPSIIILDLDMPGLDGFGVLERLGETTNTANIPVMIYSAGVGVTERKGYEWPSQVVEVVNKSRVRPFKLRDLVANHIDDVTL